MARVDDLIGDEGPEGFSSEPGYPSWVRSANIELGSIDHGLRQALRNPDSPWWQRQRRLLERQRARLVKSLEDWRRT